MRDVYGNLVRDENKSQRLCNGLFDELSLYRWIQDKEFYYINATIYGLDKVIDLELFDIIVTQMEFLLLECKDEYLESNYIKILSNAIWVAGRHPEHYGKYVE